MSGWRPRWVAGLIAGGLLVAIACGGSPGTGVPNAPDFVFTAEDGSPVTLLGLASQGDSALPLLALRVVAGWCGTCRWSTAHTEELVPAEIASRVRFVDVLIAGDQNAPAQLRDAAAWSARSDGLARVVLDPESRLRTIFPERAALPLVALVEPRSRHVLAVLSNPSPDALGTALSGALGTLEGRSVAAGPLSPRQDGRFTRDQWEMIREMALEGPPAPDPSNAVADDPRAAAFGRALFTDETLSPTGVSCVRCHRPELLFQNGRDVGSEGVRRLDRNVPTTLLSGYSDTQLWDGRSDSLWMQALLPLEAPAEFGSSRLFVAHAIFDRYRTEYEAVFGPLPDLADTARFPPHGGPGDPAWEALAPADRAAITRVFVHAGKAIAAFQRSQRPLAGALDRYARGEFDALTDEQKDGLLAFFEAGCAQCHYGPLLTDGSFHNLRFPSGRRDRAPDRGRAEGIPSLLASEFNRGGPHSDDRSLFVRPPDSPAALGSFKTPTLRGIPYTMPYGHGGSYAGLTSVLESIRSGGLPPESPYTTGTVDPFLPAFDPALTPRIIAFLSALRLEVQTGIAEASE